MTVGHVLLIGLGGLGLLVALALLGIAVMAIFAGGMSDSQEAGESAFGTGCWLVIAAAIIAALSVFGLAH